MGIPKRRASGSLGTGSEGTEDVSPHVVTRIDSHLLGLTAKELQQFHHELAVAGRIMVAPGTPRAGVSFNVDPDILVEGSRDRIEQEGRLGSWVLTSTREHVDVGMKPSLFHVGEALHCVGIDSSV